MSRIAFVDGYISRIDEALSSQPGEQSKSELVKEIVGVFASRIPDIKSGLDRYQQRVWFSDISQPQIDNTRDLRVLCKKLELYREDLVEGKTGNREGDVAGQVSVYVDNSATQTTTAKSSACATVSVTMSEAIEAVDADPKLTEEQKAELQMLLAQAKGAATKRDGGSFAGISSKIMSALATATPGLIVKLLEFLLGLATGGL